MKKAIVLLLVLALVIGCLAGCKKEEPATGDDVKTQEVTSEDQKQEDTPAAEGAALGDAPEAPEESEDAAEGEEKEEEHIDLEGLLGALEETEGDLGAIAGIIGDAWGEDIMGQLEKLGISEYLGKVSMLVSGEVVIGSYDQLLMLGFTSDMDPETPLAAGENSEPFTVSKGKTELKIRVANPTEEEIRMGSCIICSYEHAPELFFPVGSITTRETILKAFGAPYSSDEDSITYMTTAQGLVDWTELAEKLGIEHFEDDFTRTMTFVFEDDKMTSVIMEAPYYIYEGLGDNVDEEDLEKLEGMTEEEIEEMVQIRASILRSLMTEFETRGIDAVIDIRTGEITMSDSILFADNSADLTEEGKAYLDELFAAYATVLLDGQYVGRINYILVEGHASPTGTYEYNLDLSQRRAEGVMAYCLESEANGLTAEQREALTGLLVAKGFSFTDPVYDENGNVDQDASRRVAIKFFITTPATKK